MSRARSRGEHAVVVGAGVAGRAAAAALAAEGASVRRHRRARRRRRSATSSRSARRSASTSAPAATDPSDLDGADLVVASPGVPAVGRGLRLGAGARAPGLGRAGARRAARARPVPGGDRHERQDDDDRDARRVPAGRRARRGRVRQHRPPVHDGGARAARRARRRGVVVPARACSERSIRASRCCSTSRPTTSTTTAPSRPTARRRRAIFAQPARRRRPRRQPRRRRRRRPCRRRRRARVRWFRAGRAGRGEVGYDGDRLVARLGAERVGPRRDRRGARRLPRGRRRGRGGRARLRRRARGGRGGARRVRARPRTAARSSPRSTACGSSTTPRRRTCTPRSPRSTACDDAVLIAGGRAKGQDLAPLGDAAPTHLRARGRDRRGGRRASRTRSPDACPSPGRRSIEDAVGAAFATRGPPGSRAARPGVRQLGSVRLLRRARRPVRGRGARVPWRSADG